MAVTIYKPGQGYWVRVLTATMIAIITFATAGWLWQQMELVATSLPKTTWSTAVGSVQGSAKPGDRIVLIDKPARGSTQGAEVGTAEIASFDTARGALVVRDVQIADANKDITQAASVRSAGASGQSGGFSAEIKEPPVGHAAIKPAMLQGAVAITVILIGFVLAYWLAGIKRGFVEFLIATDMEMRKVNWSTRRDIMKSTWVVIAASMLIAGSLFAVDYGLQALFRGIGVLRY